MSKALAAVFAALLGAALFLALRAPALRPYAGDGLSLAYPASWKLQTADRPRVLRLSLTPRSGPALTIERRRPAAGLRPEAYAKTLGTVEAQGPARLGGEAAWQARVKVGGSVEVEDAAARSAPARRRQYYLLNSEAGLIVASYDLPAGAWARWTLDRRVRGVLASLKLEK